MCSECLARSSLGGTHGKCSRKAPNVRQQFSSTPSPTYLFILFFFFFYLRLWQFPCVWQFHWYFSRSGSRTNESLVIFLRQSKVESCPTEGERDGEMKNVEASLLRYSLDCNVTSYIKSCACVCVCYGCMQMSGICCSAFLMSLRWPDRDRDRDRETDCGNKNWTAITGSINLVFYIDSFRLGTEAELETVSGLCVEGLF